MARDHLRRGQAFLRRLVRQERRPDDVADGVDVGIRGAQLAVRLDIPARSELDPRLVRVQFVRVRPAADRDEHDVGPPGDEPLRSLDVDDRLVLVDAPPAGLRLCVDFHAQLLESAGDDPHGLGVRAGEQLVQDLNDDDAGTELGVERPDLQTGDAAADHGEIERDPRQLERLFRAEDPLAVEPEHRKVRWPAAGRDDRVLELDLFRPRGSPDRGPLRGGEGGVAHQHLDLVSLAKLADPVRKALDDGRLPLLQASHVDLDRPRLDPAFGRLLQGVHDARGVDERLARDAAVIQTLASELVPFHQEDSFPELRRPDRGRIAARARPDHEDVDLTAH